MAITAHLRRQPDETIDQPIPFHGVAFLGAEVDGAEMVA
jgi:hypothetical protein